MDYQHINTNLGIDHAKKEKLAAWSKRLSSPVLNDLDRYSEKKLILSGEFIGRINPDAYRIPKDAIALLLCSDERLNNLNLGKMFGGFSEEKSIFPIRLPGAVVGQDIGQLKEKLKEYNFPKLAAASHADCGAVKLDLIEKGLSVDIDQHAKDLASNLEDIENWGFVGIEDIPQLKGIHPACCLLVDGTGRRNYLSDDVLPNECFMLNRAVYTDNKLAASHIGVLTNIALGDHGLGSLFTREHPFYLFVSALDDESLRRYMDEAEGITKSLPGDLVRVVGFIAPRID